ncbi:hypothetical protein HYX18_03985 [Candidatus Woesearchaeota archaeon]|nr:hypothetical protein [Candidatus Woesearchaeota archaeon]
MVINRKFYKSFSTNSLWKKVICWDLQRTLVDNREILVPAIIGIEVPVI